MCFLFWCRYRFIFTSPTAIVIFRAEPFASPSVLLRQPEGRQTFMI